MSHEKLIEALREEAKALSGDGYANYGSGPMPAHRFVGAIERIADRLDVRGRVSCTTSIPPNDRFTMTRVVTIPQGTPTNAAAAAAGLPSPGSRLKDGPEWELSRIRIDSTHDPLKWVAHLPYHNVGMAPEGQQREVD